MNLLVDGISLVPGQDEADLEDILTRHLNLRPPLQWRILRKSLDARSRGRIRYHYRLVVSVSEEEGRPLLGLPGVSACSEEPALEFRKAVRSCRVGVVGSGPAGLFCALRLAEAGLDVTVMERGSRVRERMKDIQGLEEEGRLDCESNVLFGEGGAGAYSDGKLTSRTASPESRWFFQRLVDLGAPSSVLYEARSHIGTDRLVGIVTRLRERLEDMGARFFFNCRVDDLLVDGGTVLGVATADGQEHRFDHLVLATGHSARDTYAMLGRRGVAMEAKAFALGTRIEHPRDLIDDIQYGNPPFRSHLPAAEYVLTFKDRESGRGVYSFCMCPGGRIINASSEPGMLCVNGMSYSPRDLPFSNAALVVTVGPEDFGPDPLGGVTLQRRIEEQAFALGGGGFTAPAQRVTSFLKKRGDASLPASSFLPGIAAADMEECLPSWIAAPLRRGLDVFNRKMKGFISDQGLLVGVETRTSSPVRLLRGGDGRSLSHPGLYPAGEGSGYSGGIVSSAVDGIRAADAIIECPR